MGTSLFSFTLNQFYIRPIESPQSPQSPQTRPSPRLV
jgi:hypothetical protein